MDKKTKNKTKQETNKKKPKQSLLCFGGAEEGDGREWTADGKSSAKVRARKQKKVYQWGHGDRIRYV